MEYIRDIVFWKRKHEHVVSQLMEFARSPWKLMVSQIVWFLGISFRLDSMVCRAINGPVLYWLLMRKTGEMVAVHIVSKTPNRAMVTMLLTLFPPFWQSASGLPLIMTSTNTCPG